MYMFQHLQQQALNQTQLNDTLVSVLSSQQHLQQETVSLMNEMSMRHVNEQFIRQIQFFMVKILTLTNASHRLKRYHCLLVNQNTNYH